MGGTRDTVRKVRSLKPFWFDPRLAIGIGLVVASVVGVVAVVSSADSSMLVYTASTSLMPGDRIFPGDLLETSVRLGPADDRYLSSGDVPAEGLLVTRTVSAGELVPATAVGAASSIRIASVVVRVSGELSHSIVPGTVTDVWSASATDDRKFGPPSVLVGSVTVVRIVESTGLVRDAKGQVVELLVPRDKIARVLEAVADGDTITLVPVSISGSR